MASEHTVGRSRPDPGEIRKVIAQRETELTREALDALMVEIDLDIAEYLSDHFGFGATESAEAAAFKAWAPGAKDRLDEFEQWLTTTTPGAPHGAGGPLEELTHERDALVKAVDAFRGLVIGRYYPLKFRHPGRPVDYPRVFLEEGIGTTLAMAGIELTTAPDGTYARVLEAVYRAVSLPVPKANAQAAGAARRAIERHPEWKDPRIIGQKRER